MLAKLREQSAKWLQLTPNNALYDRTLLWLFFGLLVIGFVMVTSASIPVSTRLHNDPFEFARKGGISICVALFAWFVVLHIPIEKVQKYRVWFYWSALILLVVVLAVGKNVNGATRWIALIAGFNFQPAEFAKGAMLIYLAGFFVLKYDEIRQSNWAFVRPTLAVSCACGLLILQPDLGSTMVIFCCAFAMLLFVGAPLRQFIVLILGGAAAFSALIFTSEYRMKRVTAFLDPFADAYGDGFQLSNSQMALGQGQLFGQGLGNSVQKLEYLPEAHTDFIMAVIGEEFGLVGILFMMVLLVLLTLRAFKISRESLFIEERFKGFVAFGIGVLIFLQGFVNLGMALGALPTKGLTFPLVSYGGSSLIIMAALIALLMRIDYENRLMRIGHAAKVREE